MADSTSAPTCSACGAPIVATTPDQHCSACGARVRDGAVAGQDDTERQYHQEGFSLTWCGISLLVVGILTAAVVMGLPMVVPLFDFEGSAGMMLSIPVWFVSGVLVGLISPGRKVLEPVVATFLVAVPTAFLLFTGQTVKVMPSFMYVLLSALGVLFSMIGSYAGERIQLGPNGSASSP
jgi:hypothetical protein